MKNLWNRFRRWLIRKLGGYDMPLPNTPFVVQHQQLPVVQLITQHTVPSYELYFSFTETVVKERLAREIAQELMKQGLVKFHRWDDPKLQTINYRAYLRAVVPEGGPGDEF